MSYRQKYLKYKEKYLQLKNKLSGGAFEDVWNGLEEKITGEHMEQLNNTIKEYNDTGLTNFRPYPLRNTIDGIRAAFAIMSTDNFNQITGVINRHKQPIWYKENPEFSTIYNNKKYFDEFNKLINAINPAEIKELSDQSGGENDGNKVTLKGRIWNGTKLAGIATLTIFGLLVSSTVIGAPLGIPAVYAGVKLKDRHLKSLK